VAGTSLRTGTVHTDAESARFIEIPGEPIVHPIRVERVNGFDFQERVSILPTALLIAPPYLRSSTC
jgi:hypothetical protein